jgi:hypothetical protein
MCGERSIEIDGKSASKPERANPADRMAGDLESLLGSEHPRPRSELVLALAVVEARIAAGDDEEQVPAGAHRQNLDDLGWFDAKCICRGFHRGGAFLDFEQRQVGCILGEPCPHRFKAHSASPMTFSAILRFGGFRRCSKRKMPCHVPSAICPPRTGIDSCVCVSALRMCAGMSSGPSSLCV